MIRRHTTEVNEKNGEMMKAVSIATAGSLSGHLRMAWIPQ
jgi:hypothetical protein